MKYTIHTGSNNPFPRWPILPSFHDTLSYRFRIGMEWWAGELTAPVSGYGLKLPSMGKFNYHRGGISAAIIYDQGKVYFVPRYYEDTITGLNKNHELVDYKVELHPDRWYDVDMSSTDLIWLLDGELVHYIQMSLPHGWITPIFLGKGNDQNYPGGTVIKSGASRRLKIEIV